jgi:hypothetical protein
MVRAVLLSCLAAAASADLYHVTYTTGAHADAGSGQEMLIQLQGSVGNSADISLGSSFTTGELWRWKLSILESNSINSRHRQYQTHRGLDEKVGVIDLKIITTGLLAL